MPLLDDNLAEKAQFTNDCSFTRALYQPEIRRAWLFSVGIAIVPTVFIFISPFVVAAEGLGTGLWLFIMALFLSVGTWIWSRSYWKDMKHPELDIEEDVFIRLILNRKDSDSAAGYSVELEKGGIFKVKDSKVVSFPAQTPVYVVRTAHNKHLLEIRPQSKTTT